ncbi:hypothetical protein L7F22_034809 [Adiantum nelumboides]|nr:hypothetical protein [Adiantum nelumboides]
MAAPANGNAAAAVAPAAFSAKFCTKLSTPTHLQSDSNADDGNSSTSPLWHAVHRTIQSIGHLSNFLPTGTALIFQFLLPIVSDGGTCPAAADKYLTGILLVVLGLFCFIMSFTDAYKAPDGSRYYGIATPHGLWIPTAGAVPLSDISSAVANAPQYKLRFSDFVHGGLSIVVFIASSLFDPDVKGCFHCSLLPGHLQTSLPIVVAFFASLLLLIFPSERHGFDEPPAIASPPLCASTPISRPLLA